MSEQDMEAFIAAWSEAGLGSYQPHMRPESLEFAVELESILASSTAPIDPSSLGQGAGQSAAAGGDGASSGAPCPPAAPPSWLPPVLTQLGAKPGQYLVSVVMEYCDGGNLRQAIKRGVFRTGPGRTAHDALLALVRTAKEIAQGMCHLHHSHVLHLDLRPDNVLLKSSGQDGRGFVAKVADFGLAQPADQHTGQLDASGSARYGAVGYQAPETVKVGSR